MLTMVIVLYVLRSTPIEKVNERITYVGRTKPLKKPREWARKRVNGNAIPCRRVYQVTRQPMKI